MNDHLPKQLRKKSILIQWKANSLKFYLFYQIILLFIVDIVIFVYLSVPKGSLVFSNVLITGNIILFTSLLIFLIKTFKHLIVGNIIIGFHLILSSIIMIYTPYIHISTFALMLFQVVALGFISTNLKSGIIWSVLTLVTYFIIYTIHPFLPVRDYININDIAFVDKILFVSSIFLVIAVGFIYEYTTKTLVGKLYDQGQIFKDKAHTDSLTKLGNKRLFNEHIEHLTAYPYQQFGLLYIDLNEFKPVNDTYGHDTGDEVLKIVSYRLTQIIREDDNCFRIGGDEFTVILIGIPNHSILYKITQKIIQKIEEPIIIKKQSIFISCSIGATIFPIDSGNKNEIIKLSDSLMYKAKSNSNKVQMKTI